jgi:diguanylate cyclase (GGDEF)-like protein/putative nucleotidyltransferase with HDIG domain
VTILSTATVVEAAKVMAVANVGCLVVTDAKGALAGLFGERDIASRVLAAGLNPANTIVRDVMSSEVVSIRAGTPIERAEELMTLHKIRHLPVTAAGRVVGMISSRDVIGHQVRTSRAKQTAAEQVAMLSTSLKNLDFDDVVAMIVREVPRIFSATRAVACLDRKGPKNRKSNVIKSQHCLCPQDKLTQRRDVRQAAKSDLVQLGQAPLACRQCKVSQRMLLIPIDMDIFSENSRSSAASNYICMCDLADNDLDPDVLNYKASLAREVISYNLSHARMWLEAKSLVLTDSLTGAGTRKVLESTLEAETLRATRYRRSYSVAMIDIDRFKSINDNLGHQVGDRVLAEVGRCFQAEKRLTDTLVRYGGDEFVLVLPETNLHDAVRAMERLRLKIKSLQVAKDFTITISCGVAEFSHMADLSPNELIRRADMALFRAKKLGRDRIETWESVSASGITGPVKIETPQLQTLHNRVASLSAQSKDFFIQSVHGLVQALEARDPYTKSHSDNVLRYAVAIAETMGLAEMDLDTVRIAAMIHDIGKLGVPDSILLKPGRLTPAERQIMEEHPLIAVRILDTMRFLERELPAVRNHHERWDGSGYPDHLAATRIPLEARILAAADAFDAMTSTRVYHQSRTIAQAQDILRECSGTQFDPKVADAFIGWIRGMNRKLKTRGVLMVRDLLDTKEVATFAA